MENELTVRDRVEIIHWPNGQIQREWRKKLSTNIDQDSIETLIRYHDNGIIGHQEWRINKKWHRDNDEPACFGYYKNGNPSFQSWLRNDLMHRDGDLPAEIRYYENGNIRTQAWYRNGNLHRNEDLPAIIQYSENGNIQGQSWWQNNRIYRRMGMPASIFYDENGKIYIQRWPSSHQNNDIPTWISYYANGYIRSKEWHRFDRLHRDGDMPARIDYYENGTMKSQSWYQNGRIHRETAPAYIDANSQSWHLFGVKVTEKIMMRPQELTLDDIVSESNPEVRRIMIERMGAEKYLSLVNPEILDIDSHNHNGTRALLKTSQGVWLVCACPSTGRVYHMEVPPETKTCEEADQYLRGQISGRIIGAS